MSRRQLERLLDLLGDLTDVDWLDGQQRDDISRLRCDIQGHLDGDGEDDDT